MIGLTAEDHHEDDEDLLGQSERGHVTETDTRHTGQSEIERRGVRHST